MLPHPIEPGRRLRVTLRKAVWGWAGNQRTLVHPAGTVYEGTAGPVEADTWFELRQDDGQLAHFSTYDSDITVSVVAQ
jgi:hypothetical protein